MSQKRDAAIVGIYEYPLRVVGPGVSSLQIKAESAAKALADAGLDWNDVDGIFDTAEGGGGGLGIAEPCLFYITDSFLAFFKHSGGWES